MKIRDHIDAMKSACDARPVATLYAALRSLGAGIPKDEHARLARAMMLDSIERRCGEAAVDALLRELDPDIIIIPACSPELATISIND